ncbi:YbaN family protein [Lysobacter sp. 1R34A]|uniref:YbaN family protein n=1 Tax=Lysobacter sp. 1R34A TaxID=3445786 RepID=UPI003EED6533
MPVPPPPAAPEPPPAPAADAGEGRGPSKARPGRFRWAWRWLAYASLALGAIGIVVPGLPTVPFVLLSAFAAGRGSERLHAWLLGHRRFGPMIRDWEQHGAVSRRSKWLAVSMMAASSVVMFLTSPKLWMAMTGTAIMIVVAVWLWRRPEPPRA